MRAHPRFQDAIRLGCEPYREVVLVDNEPWFAKYIGDLANNILETAALYFHLMATLRGEGNGATLGRLQLLAFVHGFASPRRVTMYVKRMVQIGRLSYAIGNRDRRVRRLIPSAALIETSRRHFSLLFRGVDVIWPGSDLTGRLLRDNRYFYEMLVEMGQAYVAGADPVRPFDDVRHFTSKDAGTFLMNTLLTECMRGHPGLSADTEFAINYSDIARLCGVSRTHVRNVIESAADRELIVATGEGGRSLRFTEKFIVSYERFFACLLILTHEGAMKVGSRLKS